MSFSQPTLNHYPYYLSALLRMLLRFCRTTILETAVWQVSIKAYKSTQKTAYSARLSQNSVLNVNIFQPDFLILLIVTKLEAVPCFLGESKAGKIRDNSVIWRWHLVSQVCSVRISCLPSKIEFPSEMKYRENATCLTNTGEDNHSTLELYTCEWNYMSHSSLPWEDAKVAWKC